MLRIDMISHLLTSRLFTDHTENNHLYFSNSLPHYAWKAHENAEGVCKKSREFIK